MRIAQVAPLYESVPPLKYGGTERVVSYLTEELVRSGHEVTLYASGDSKSRASLWAPCEKSLRMHAGYAFEWVPHFSMFEQIIRDAEDFDIIHFHTDYMHFPFTRRLPIPHVTTLHGRLDFPQLQALYNEYDDVPLISISNNQRMPLPQANWVGTIYHGIPEDIYGPLKNPTKDYVAFLGRVSSEKGLDRAIEITRRAGLKLKVAAKVDPMEKDYFNAKIKPLIRHSPHVEFIGEISEKEKNEFLGNALALLFPIEWPEPFGLVMIEAMACGTPVVAYPRGSVLEVMQDGVSGYIVDNIPDAVERLLNIDGISRQVCRDYFEGRFSITVSTQEYVEVYHKLINEPRNQSYAVRSPYTGVNSWKTSSSTTIKFT